MIKQFLLKPDENEEAEMSTTELIMRKKALKDKQFEESWRVEEAEMREKALKVFEDMDKQKELANKARQHMKVVDNFKQLNIAAEYKKSLERKDKKIKATSIRKDMMDKHSKKVSAKKDKGPIDFMDNAGEIFYSTRTIPEWKPPLPSTCCTHLCARPMH